MEHEQTQQQELDLAKHEAWEESEDRKELELLRTEGAQKYFQTEFPDLRHAFSDKLEAVVCMDEGCAHKDYGGKEKLTVAGSGILLPAASTEERVKIAARLFGEMGIKDITSHGGCGAVGLAYKRDFPQANPSAQDLEEYGQKWAQKVAAEMGRMGHEATADHIPAEEMERPVEFHNARAVYFDGVGGFNPSKEIGLPMGFVVSRRFLPEKYAAEELKVAANIAFGHHGFGDLFSAEEPFMIIAFAASAEELNNLRNEIRAALQGDKNYEAGRIKIDGAMVEKSS